jgi:beta-fructofuranosidase
VQGIPRTLALDSKTGVNLIEWPIEEVDALRGEKLSMTDVKLNAGALVEVEGAAGGQVSATKGPEIACCSLHPHLKNHLQNWPLVIILVMVVHGLEMTWSNS